MQTFRFIDRSIGKPNLKNLILWTFHNYGPKTTITVSERLKELGFRFATAVGVSIGRQHFMRPKEKHCLLNISEKVEEKITLYKATSAKTHYEANITLITK
jgi:DNA-directed RNA polymerase subunit beta'